MKTTKPKQIKQILQASNNDGDYIVRLHAELDRDAHSGGIPLRGLVAFGVCVAIGIVIFLIWRAGGTDIWRLGTLGWLEAVPITLSTLGLALFARDWRLHAQRQPFVKQAQEESVRQGRYSIERIEAELALDGPGTAIGLSSRGVLLGIPCSVDRAHHLHLGQTGSGKSIDATWHLTLWPAAAIVFDPKGAELHAQTAHRRAGRFGADSIFCFSDSGAESDSIDIANYFDLDNPVQFKRLYEVLLRTAEEKEKFWTDYAFSIFDGVRDVAKAKGVHFIDALMGIIMLGISEIHRVLQEYSSANAASFFGQAYKKGIDYQRAQFGAQMTIVAKLATLRPFFPLLRVQTIPLDWSQQSATIYMNFDLKQIATTAPIAELMLEALMRREQDVRKHKRAQMAQPILVLLDEFPHLGIRRMSTDLATLGSLGIRYSLFAQDIAQLRATYGRDGADSIVNNCQVKVYHKTNDPATMQQISELFGNQLVIAKSKASNWDETISHRSVPALTVAQIGSLAMSVVIVHTGMVKGICQRLLPLTQAVLSVALDGHGVSEGAPRPLPALVSVSPLKFEAETKLTAGREDNDGVGNGKPW